VSGDGVDGRFPGFDVLGQTPHWDQVTAALVAARTGPPPAAEFFTPAERATAAALLDLLIGQHGPNEPGDPPAASFRVPVLEMVEAWLAAGQTDGWRYEDMPEDGQAWHDTLLYLDEDARRRTGTTFAEAGPADQRQLVQAVQDLKAQPWHGLPAGHVWSLWTRYACTAFYAHPLAWNEIGFPGPAYPRGYKNPGVDALEPYEVRDARPGIDPVRKGD
jgi:catechol 2,3-dioxygenase-like lactoylglutathione lyase family enzyme